MGDTSRRRSSMWDVEEQNRSFSSRGRYREYSASGADNSLRPKDHSGWISWEDKDDSVAKDQVDIAEMRDQLEKNSHYKNMSPGLDGLGQQNWSHSPDNRWSRSRRYSGRGRSRSRSRSRSGGRSRRREKSRSRSRGRNRGRLWSKSRSRSRGSARGQTRSRSPFHDQGRESYGWSDRRSGSGRLSETCRNFAVGMCRRGSQCRFLHPDNVDHGDAKSLEAGLAGKWRSKPESGRGSRYPYDKPQDKFSDGEDEPLRNRSGGTVSCVEFMKGKCRFGAACRFSHHSASQNNDYDRGFRNTPVDPDLERRQNKSGKAMCKFFLAGKCQRDNCRFSHDGPTPDDFEDRSRDNHGGQSAGDVNKWWDGPMWDDAARPSNIRTETGWGEDGVANMDLSEEFSVDRRNEGRWGHNLESESEVLGSTGHDDKGFNRDKYPPFYQGDGNSRGDMGTAKPLVIESCFREQGDHLASENFQLQNADRFSPHQRQNLSGEAPSHYLSTTLPKLPVNSDIHQYQVLAEENSVKVFGSGPFYELKDSINTNGESVNPDHTSAFAENSSVLNGADQGLHVMSPMSNTHHVDLNRPVQQIGSPLGLHNENQSHQHEGTTAELRESNVPYSFPAAVPSEQVAPITIHPPHLTQNLVDELRQQLRAVSGPSDSTSRAPHPSTAHPVPSGYTLNITDSVPCPDEKNPVNNCTEHAKSGNDGPPPGNSSYSNGQENQKPMEPLLSSFVNLEFGKTHHGGYSGMERHDVSKLDQQETTEKSEVNGNGKIVALDSKSGPQNTSENVDGQGKEEGGNSNKDDKGIRLFKNALIEFVKEILKPTWKEGRMSREVHKTIVKKVVDKVTSSIQGEHVPKTPDRIEQYLSSSKPKITKLVQAYVERSHKTDS